MAGLRLMSVIGPEPVDEQQFRRWARISEDDESSTVREAISGGRARVEDLSCRQIVLATYRQTYDCFHQQIRLYRPPLLSVQAVRYLDTDGGWQTLGAESYVVDADSEPGRVTLANGESWPDTLKQANAVVIEFTAGYASPSEVPAGLRRLVLDVATLIWYGKDMPPQIEAMIAGYKHGALEVAGQ